MSAPIGQHNVEIQRNRQAWERKPQLRAVYRQFYELIARQIDPDIPGLVVELGSGMGNIKAVIPQCLTTDIFPNPWLDRQENAYQLSFPDQSVSHLILFDVWHHLRYPGTTLREFHRVLHPQGKVIMLEPAMSWAGRQMYHHFHHEPVGLTQPITWEAPANFSASDLDYYAVQSAASRHFWQGEAHDRLKGWNLLSVKPIVSLAYMASGGFSGPRLGGRFLGWFMGGVDRILRPCHRLFATRLLVVLQKKAP